MCWRWASALPIVLLVGCGGGPPPGGPPQGGPIEVTVAAPLRLQIVDWDAYTGRLAAIDQVDIRARVSGYLMSHHFEEGQVVQQGDLLFVIDSRPYEAALAQAKAARAEAVAKRSQSDSTIREAEARKQQVIAKIELAQAQERRARPLVPSGAISDDEYDVLVSEVRQSQADGYAADAEIEAAKAAQVAADAAIATAEAAIEAAQLDLDYCRIEAPITGRIGRRLVTQGNLISAGSLGTSPLTTIVSIGPIHAYFDANEQALMKYIRLDRAKKRANSRDAKNPVYAALVDEDDFPHKGYIDFVDNRIDQSTGSIRARAIFPNEDQVLTSGAFVRCRIPGSAPYEALLLPDSAIASDQTSKLVYVVGEDGKVATRRITTGPLSKGLRVIRSGLAGDERVVIHGLQRCRPGATAKATAEELTPGDDEGLPDTYEPVPPEEWLRPANPAGPDAARRPVSYDAQPRAEAPLR